VEVTDAMLISTDVPEADYAVWGAGTTYALGDRVIVTTGAHKIYESLAAGNIGHTPATSVAWWLEVSPTNRWRLFDGSNSSSTAKSTSMSYTLRPGSGINAVALLNVVGANTVRIRLTHPTYGTVYDKTTSLASLPSEVGWWQWFFGTRTAPPQLVVTDLPSLPGCDLIVDITGTTNLSVGVLLFGQLQSIGQAVSTGARLGIRDYSRKETNAFGDTVLAQRAYAKRASFEITVPASEVDATADYLARLRATPCLWIGSPAFGATVIYGFYQEFEVNIAYASLASCTLQLEGLT
jgi:hypothetical protein